MCDINITQRKVDFISVLHDLICDRKKNYSLSLEKVAVLIKIIKYKTECIFIFNATGVVTARCWHGKF